MTNSPIKLLLCIYTEKVHRGIFDKQYRQDYEIAFKDRPVLLLYSVLMRIVPDFRPYLKRWKELSLKAYNQKRLSIIGILLLNKLNKINVIRYSGYLQAIWK